MVHSVNILYSFCITNRFYDKHDPSFSVSSNSLPHQEEFCYPDWVGWVNYSAENLTKNWGFPEQSEFGYYLIKERPEFHQ